MTYAEWLPQYHQWLRSPAGQAYLARLPDPSTPWPEIQSGHARPAEFRIEWPDEAMVAATLAVGA